MVVLQYYPANFYDGVYLLCPKLHNWLLFQQKNESKSAISLFRFHSNPVLCQKWIRAIPRENLNVSDSCRICAKHFTESDIQTMTTSFRKIRESGDELDELKRVVVVVVVVYPTPSEGWRHGGRPWSPRCRATPQGLDQRS